MSANDAPLNYFLHAHGPAAQPTLLLDWVFAAIVVSTCFIIALLLLTAILHKRPAGNLQKIARESDGLRWIYVGTGISTAVLFGMAIYALVTLNESTIPRGQPALTITVTGYDWWWKVQYDGFETANEIHIPVGVPVLIKLKSADVIHAFWVPQLAGKTQMIPGLTNQQWIEADEPGIYRGQCTQFCGLQHAHMAFEVVAQSQTDFQKWQEAQQQPMTHSVPPVFMERCAACHTVRGTLANGDHGPDLTHLNSRRLIAAGMFTNTSEHLADWIAHVQELKPGTQMPDIALSSKDASALSAYLATLK